MLHLKIRISNKTKSNGSTNFPKQYLIYNISCLFVALLMPFDKFNFQYLVRQYNKISLFYCFFYLFYDDINWKAKWHQMKTYITITETGRDVVMACFKILGWHSPAATEKNKVVSYNSLQYTLLSVLLLT